MLVIERDIYFSMGIKKKMGRCYYILYTKRRYKGEEETTPLNERKLSNE
jgi:hypothetical protein